jgi:hypothetical protein
MKKLLFALPVILLVAAGCNSPSSNSTTTGQQQSPTVKTTAVEIKSSGTVNINIDPTVSIENQITHGNYKFAHTDINSKNFSLTVPAGKYELTIFEPQGYVSTDQIINRMTTYGCKPATLDYALAIGTQFPDLQRKNPLVFLGTVRKGGSNSWVPILELWDNDRVMVLTSYNDDVWSSDYRFAAVCKP